MGTGAEFNPSDFVGISGGGGLAFVWEIFFSPKEEEWGEMLLKNHFRMESAWRWLFTRVSELFWVGLITYLTDVNYCLQLGKKNPATQQYCNLESIFRKIPKAMN